jgi:16S rRNA (uracil1498-N3)-methyltransferase
VASDDAVTAPHFFCASVEADLLRIEGADARHARSLRLRVGETVTVSDGRGMVATTCVREAADSRGGALTLEVLERRTVDEEPPLLIVYPAVPKADKLDLVVQKLTEIGVAAIKPWPAARSIARWDARKTASVTARLQAIAREASMQSRRPFLASVDAPAPPTGLPVPTFVLHEGSGLGLSAALPAGRPDVIGLVTGPEGGLTDEELATLEAAGARAVGLGPQILRTETAAIVAVALVLGRYGKLG